VAGAILTDGTAARSVLCGRATGIAVLEQWRIFCSPLFTVGRGWTQGLLTGEGRYDTGKS